MKSPADRAKKLTKLLKTLPAVEPVVFPDSNDPVAVLVQSWLLWETTTPRALTAYAALRERFVDFNDLRVSMSDEIVEALPSRYPAAVDRSERLRATLRAIYLREHAVSLQSVQEQGKRDARRYVESLEGIVPYVSARLVLLAFGTHVIPVDGALLAKLREEDLVDDGATEADASGVLTRAVKAGDGEAVHTSLQAWVEGSGGSAPAGRSGARRGRAADAGAGDGAAGSGGAGGGAGGTTTKPKTSRSTPKSRRRTKSEETG